MTKMAKRSVSALGTKHLAEESIVHSYDSAIRFDCLVHGVPPSSLAAAGSPDQLKGREGVLGILCV